MTGALTGTLRLQSAGSSADVSLHFDSGERVTPEPVLTTTGECRVRLALTETPFTRSLAGRAATAALFIGETLLVRQPVILTPEKRDADGGFDVGKRAVRGLYRCRDVDARHHE